MRKTMSVGARMTSEPAPAAGCRWRTGPGRRPARRPSCARWGSRRARARAGTGSTSRRRGGWRATRWRAWRAAHGCARRGPASGAPSTRAASESSVRHAQEVGAHPEDAEGHVEPDERQDDGELRVVDAQLAHDVVERDDDARERQRQPEQEEDEERLANPGCGGGRWRSRPSSRRRPRPGRRPAR